MFKFTEKEATRWEKVREQGKWFFIARQTILLTAAFILVTIISDLIGGDPIEFKPFIFLIFIPTGGFLGAWVTWWGNDGNYKNYELDRKIEKGLRSQI